MASSPISYGAVTAITAYFDPCAVPLALTASSVSARLAAETAVFAAFPHTSAELPPCRAMFGLDPSDEERVAAISDMTQFELAVWWLTRSRRLPERTPYPLRSVHFCLESSIESSVDVVARVPLCAATVTSLNLSARGDTCNHLSSLQAITQLVGLRELLMPHTTVLQSSRPLPVTMTDALHAVFRNLRKLVVGDYYLVKQLPLADLNYLEEVDLSGTGVTTAVVEAIARCPRVSALRLRGCCATDSFRPLGALRRLTLLDLAYTRFRNDELRHVCCCCPQLATVRLHHCDALHDFSPLAELTQLTCLHVGRTAFRNADLERVCALPLLTELSIESCRLVDVFAPLANVTELRLLNARDTWMDDAGVEALSACCHLTHLNLSHCGSIRSFAPLARLPRLQQLSLSSTLVTDACLSALCTSAVPLQSLLLNGCRQLHDFRPLSRLTCVEEIGVCDTAFDDAALQAVAQCDTITKLHLHICVAVTSLQTLLSCTRLRYLGIGGTRFSTRSCETECLALRERGVQLNHQLFLVSAY